jgi:hypothetical protein
MRGDVKDILSIPKYLDKVDPRNQKESKPKGKDEVKKNELAIKDALILTQGLFPMKTHRNLIIPKNSTEVQRVKWKHRFLNFKAEEVQKKP